MKEEYRTITLEWLSKAESDFDYAVASFKEFDRFFSQICILCHDATEKYLKGFIAAQGEQPERTHDLVTLWSRCAALQSHNDNLLNIEQQCKVLNRYYTPLKYPSHYPQATQAQAREAIDCAQVVRDTITIELQVN